MALHGLLHVIEKGGIACTEMQDASEVLREDVQNVDELIKGVSKLVGIISNEGGDPSIQDQLGQLIREATATVLYDADGFIARISF